MIEATDYIRLSPEKEFTLEPNKLRVRNRFRYPFRICVFVFIHLAVLCIGAVLIPLSYGLSAVHPWQTTRYIFVLYLQWMALSEVSGDSYSSTEYNVNGEQPSNSNPLGNPPFPGKTVSRGPNWVLRVVSCSKDRLVTWSPSSIKLYFLHMILPFLGVMLET
jgi:hypothetical protein